MNCSRHALAVLALLTSLAAPASHAQKTTIQPTDIANLKGIAAPRISPDGKLIAYTVETPEAAGKHRNAHIWLVSTGGSDAGRRLPVRPGSRFLS